MSENLAPTSPRLPGVAGWLKPSSREQLLALVAAAAFLFVVPAADSTGETAALQSAINAADAKTQEQVHDSARVVQLTDTAIPGSIRIRVGDTVTWINAGKTDNAIVGLRDEAIFLRSPFMAPSEAYTLRFTQPGKFEYMSSMRPEFGRSTVIVTSK